MGESYTTLRTWHGSLFHVCIDGFVWLTLVAPGIQWVRTRHVGDWARPTVHPSWLTCMPDGKDLNLIRDRRLQPTFNTETQYLLGLILIYIEFLRNEKLLYK